MNIFEFDDYKRALRDLLEAKKRLLGNRVTSEKLAKACGIQKTYLSRVLNDSAHLSSDQLFLACQYLAVNETDREYLMLLHERQRSHIPERRAQLERSLETMRREQLRSNRYVQSEQTQMIKPNELYFMDPLLPLVHVFLTIDQYAKQPRNIAQTLNISIELLTSALNTLQQMNLIAFTAERCEVLVQAMHLNPESSAYNSFRTNQRINALQRIQWLPKDRSYNFSVTFSADAKTKKLIHKKFLEFLSEVRLMAESADKEEVYQMVFDLFDWS